MSINKSLANNWHAHSNWIWIVMLMREIRSRHIATMSLLLWPSNNMFGWLGFQVIQVSGIELKRVGKQRVGTGHLIRKLILPHMLRFVALSLCALLPVIPQGSIDDQIPCLGTVLNCHKESNDLSVCTIQWDFVCSMTLSINMLDSKRFRFIPKKRLVPESLVLPSSFRGKNALPTRYFACHTFYYQTAQSWNLRKENCFWFSLCLRLCFSQGSSLSAGEVAVNGV